MFKNMKLSNIKYKTNSLVNTNSETRLMFLYRYVSWFITSTFYILGEPRSPVLYKLGVVASLLAAAKLVNSLYSKSKDNAVNLKPVVICEMLCISALLIPTGGITSPFIWYAINPVLISAAFLSPLFCWANLIFYISFSLAVTYELFNAGKRAILDVTVENLNTILVLILITIVIKMLSNLTKELKIKANELSIQSMELKEANVRLEHSKNRSDETLKDTMSLYQAVEAFTCQSSISDFLKIFSEHALKLTKASASFFWIASDGINGSLFASTGNMNNNVLGEKAEMLWNNRNNLPGPSRIIVGQSNFLMMVVKGRTKDYGLMGLELRASESIELMDELLLKINFLSELSGIIIERFYFEKMAEELMLAEEQNRIASEIHDNVSQRVFSISCAIHTLKFKWEGMTREQTTKRLELIHESLKEAMKELRWAIYKLSNRKRGENRFEIDLRKYLDEFSQLNNVEVKFNVSGDIEAVHGDIKRAVQRIIYEASGNSFRHGKCKNISITLSAEKSVVKLFIEDNGVGFDSKNVSETGLGLNNIRSIVNSLNGSINLESSPGLGTKITVCVPENQFADNAKREMLL